MSDVTVPSTTTDLHFDIGKGRQQKFGKHWLRQILNHTSPSTVKFEIGFLFAQLSYSHYTVHAAAFGTHFTEVRCVTTSPLST